MATIWRTNRPRVGGAGVFLSHSDDESDSRGYFRVIVSLHWILHTSLASFSLSLAHSLWYNGRPVVELEVVELHYLYKELST